MIGLAPLRRAPCTQFSPTPPQPYTATLSPGRICTVFSAAPTPVVTAQPTRAATSNEMSSGITTHDCSGAIACSAKVDTTLNWVTCSPFSVSRVLPSCMVPSCQYHVVSHSPFWSRRQ